MTPAPPRPARVRSRTVRVAGDDGVAAQALAAALLEAPLPGLLDVVPSYASVFVESDADVLPDAVLEARLATAAAHAVPPAGREVRLPVRYDGPDLAAVADALGTDVADVVARHAAATYRVAALGFTPGFPFLTGLDPTLAHPRHPHPRARVPAHAVAIADHQAGIYPAPSPGGWQLLGTALEAAYAPTRATPFLLAPGDAVRFVPGDGPTPPEPAARPLRPDLPDHPRLEVLEAGLADLVVDGGRTLAGRFGLARGGPLDAPAALRAQRAVGNPAGAPLLEVAHAGPRLRAVDDVVVAFAGGGVRPLRNGAPLPDGTGVALARGDVLHLAPGAPGARGYLALAGGLASDTFLGSATTDLRGRIGRPLAAGEVLGVATPRRARPGFAVRARAPLRSPGGVTSLRLTAGPHPDADALAALLRGRFVVRSADRTGVRLDGPDVPGGQGVSEGTPLGAVQVPPGGAPTILLHDRGSLGGYALPARLHPADVPRAAQLRAGDVVRFAFVRGQYATSSIA